MPRLVARLVIATLLWAGAPWAAAAGTAFLVAAPDRGFLGNEEIRDQFDRFADRHAARLVFVTDARTTASIQSASEALAAEGASELVVLPLFLSRGEARFARLRAAIEASSALPVRWARPWGETYLAVEFLADRLAGHAAHGGGALVLAGGGAGDVEGAAQIARDLERLARQATAGRTFESIAAAVWPEHHVPEEARLKGLAESALEAHAGAVVVPLHLGKRLDGMMALSIAQRRAAPEGSHWVDEAPLDALLLTWMQREANRALPWQSGEDGNVGVVIAAHGSDWHWNETMRQAVAPLAARYRLAFAYSMADPIIVERAVRRLEAQGAQAIVVVRVFGLEDSFRSAFRRMAGLDVEDALAVDGSASHEHGQGHVPTMAAPDGHGHHGHGAAAGSGRIRSPAVLLTAGGLDDDPLFARALLARADALSRDPARETLILTAHGTFSDERNARWLEVLARIADRMRAEGADRFRDIRVATWREDWPDKREAWVPRVRAWVEAASEDGTAIVIPARTNGTGPEARLLEGLDFRLGSGFAPHPLFAEWVESQVRSALEQARRPPVPAMARIDRITP